MAKSEKAKTESENAQLSNAFSSNKSLVGTSKIPISTRGRTFKGVITKKFSKRVVIEFERTVFVKKYDRFYKKKTRLHARLPDSFANEINIGDYVKIRETRPLSKIIHHIVIEKLTNFEKTGEKK